MLLLKVPIPPWTKPICIPIPEPNTNPEFQIFCIPEPIPIPVAEIQEQKVLQ